MEKMQWNTVSFVAIPLDFKTLEIVKNFPP